jgi:hypothetical protein
LSIVDFRPTPSQERATSVHYSERARFLANRQSEIDNEKSPGAKQRDFKSRFEVFRACRFGLPELFSWLFYVAASRLNSPRLSSLLIRPGRGACQAVKLQESVLFLLSA